MFQELNEKCNVKPYIRCADLQIKKKYEVVKLERYIGQFGLGIVIELKEAKFSVPKRYIDCFTQDLVDKANDCISKGAKIKVESRGPLDFNSTDLHFYGSRLFGHLNKLAKYKDFVKCRDLVVKKRYQVYNFKISDASAFGRAIILQTKSVRVSLPDRFTHWITEEVIYEANSKIKAGVKIFLVSNGPIGMTTDIRIYGGNNMFAAINKMRYKHFIKCADLEVGKRYNVQKFSTFVNENGPSVIAELNKSRVYLPDRYVKLMPEKIIQAANERIAMGFRLNLKSNGTVGTDRFTTNLEFQEVKKRGQRMEVDNDVIKEEF